ncbi:zinc-ribbon domain-containing protein, partial [Faecalibacterium prausnitzii]|uniref:zinc-ribbon domain-containing protein n=1 Tax=Faecalibacterium prausnitzii TaxID=853 RepID=UPI0029157B8D|nr:zinc-ribbon domain-containing protein [Faecalibacterium prausnitzii]
APAPAPAAPAQSAAFAPAPSFQQPTQPVQQPVQQPAQPAAPQTSVCPSCGEPIPADATFCINCGAKLD